MAPPARPAAPPSGPARELAPDKFIDGDGPVFQALIVRAMASQDHAETCRIINDYIATHGKLAYQCLVAFLSRALIGDDGLPADPVFRALVLGVRRAPDHASACRIIDNYRWGTCGAQPDPEFPTDEERADPCLCGDPPRPHPWHDPPETAAQALDRWVAEGGA